MKNILLILIVSIAIVSCKKKNETPESGTPYVYTPPPNNPLPASLLVPIPADADGILMASRTPVTFSGSYITQVGDASAFFYTSPTNYALLDAGIVKCNDSLMAKLSGGSYSYKGKAKNGQPESGIQYSSSGSVWNISGNGSVPSFSVTHSVFPTDAAITSATVFPKTNPYTVTFSGVTNADSVIIFFGGDSTEIKKIVNASVGYKSFTAAEVASVRKKTSNNAYFSFVPYKLMTNTISSKKYYFVNATTATYSVIIQ